MGMGRYQWELFVLCGFGWFADNFWLQVRLMFKDKFVNILTLLGCRFDS